VQIAWECGDGAPCAHALDARSLRMADAIGRRLSAAEGVRSVVGPANAPLLVAQDGGFGVRRFVERGELAADNDSLRALAQSDALWQGTLVSRDGRVAVVVVQPADTRPTTDILVVDAIRATLAPFEAEGYRFHLAGDAVEGYLGGLDLAESNSRLVPFAVLVMAAMLYLLTRSWVRSLAVLATMGVTLVWTFGLLGWLGWPRDGILEVLAPLLLIVGVCDAMHLLSQLSVAGDAAPHGRAATALLLRVVAYDIGGACAFATFTDAAAFLSFSTSELDTFVRFGWISAFGVIAALVLTFSLLPLLVLWLPDATPARGTDARWSALLDRITAVAQARRRPILALSALAMLLFGASWHLLLRVDTDWLESWGDHSERTRAIRFLQDHLGQLKTLEMRLTLPHGAAHDDADAMAAVGALQSSLERVDEVSGTTSVVDLVARANRLLHDDDPRFERAPDEPGAAAEILELLSLDDDSILRPWVSVDRSQARLSIETQELAFQDGQRFVRNVERASAAVVARGWQVDLTGEIPMTVDWVQDVQATQLVGFPTAVLTVYLLIALFLRSFRLALAALLPTLLPLVVVLGSMGLLGLSLDVGRAMVGSVVIGIGVDDAIHLLSQDRVSRARGATVHAAMSRAIQHSGRAIVTNSLALTLGFLTLLASAWQSISSFGFFVALAILGALVSTLFVTPALVFTFGRDAAA
jgi:predicted RND superfamily exporter protein